MVTEVTELPEPDPSCPSCQALAKKLDELVVVVEKLSTEVSRLKARPRSTPRNSSKPPSSAPWGKGATRKAKKPRSRTGQKPALKRGAQPGHEGKSRTPSPPDEVHQVRPECCEDCASPLTGNDRTPRRHQTVDIPPVTPRVIEHALHALRCEKCGKLNRAKLPSHVRASTFGPNVSAFVAMLTGRYRVSRRDAQRLLADMFGLNISLGAISNIERRVSEGLSVAHAKVLEAAQNAPVGHIDETTWYGPNGGEWAWTVTAPGLAAHVIRSTRGKVVATELLSEKPTGVTVCDRYVGYKFIGLDRKQVCLAHIRRDFVRMSEGEKDFRSLGVRLLGLLDEVFRLWHMFQRDEVERSELRRWSRQARKRMLALLHEGATARGYDTPGRCRGLLESEPAMWTFVDVEGVPPTNNDAERAIRPVVLARKVSLGSRSERGSRFVERMQTVAGTLTRQGRRMHEFVLQAATAALDGGAPPTLFVGA